MDFRTRKIRYRKKRSILSSLGKSLKGLIVKDKEGVDNNKKISSQFGIIAIIIIIIVLFLYGCSAVISRIGLINIIGIFGENLETDQYGNTNILLLGTGGEGHDGPDLTDTVLVASIDHKNKIVPMVSIPRDFYVNVDELGGGMKINHVYAEGKSQYGTQRGLEIVTDSVEEITGLDIHYYIKIDFEGFKDIVDSLDGVDIFIENAIYDPEYPLDGTIKYETFSLSAGQQELDGETALKYVRSRKSTSDFDRSKRQQKLLFAIKNKAMTKNVLLDPGKIKNLYSAVNSHIDTNLSIRHIIELAKISQDINADSIVTKVITDDPSRCGGFLYPPDQDLFNGAFVLVPIGNHYDFIHQYIDLIFHYPEINTHPVQIQVLNGTKTAGLAGESKALLDRLCFDVIRYGNARSQDITTTTLYYKDPNKGTEDEGNPPEALTFIQQLIPGTISNEIPDKYFESQYISDADIIIELGSDYAESKPEDIFFLYYPQATPSNEETDEETTDDEAADAAEAPAPETPTEAPAE